MALNPITYISHYAMRYGVRQVFKASKRIFRKNTPDAQYAQYAKKRAPKSPKNAPMAQDMGAEARIDDLLATMEEFCAMRREALAEALSIATYFQDYDMATQADAIALIQGMKIPSDVDLCEATFEKLGVCADENKEVYEEVLQVGQKDVSLVDEACLALETEMSRLADSENEADQAMADAIACMEIG